MQIFKLFEFLRRDSGASYEEVDRMIDEISNVPSKSSLKLLELIKQFLDVSRLMKSDVQKLEVSLFNLLQGCVSISAH